MRVKKKLINLGGTKAVILPRAWFTDLKRRYGATLTAVYLNIDDDIILITPAWEEEQ